MKVALFQYPVVWAEVQENLRLTERRLQALVGEVGEGGKGGEPCGGEGGDESGGVDVVVLPEMFTTGFCTHRPELAEPVDGVTVATLLRWAKRYGVAIVGSFMCQEGGKLYNRGFFAKPDGEIVFIDKRHLYRGTGCEAKFFTPGTERTVVMYKGVKFCLQICYDLRFPVWSRNTTGFDYDILIYCAAWPQVKIAAWDIMLASRGIENQCYVVGVNCVGDDGMGVHYPGHSVAYDTWLNKLVWFADDEEGVKVADFDMEGLVHFREVLPAWKDSDKFSLKKFAPNLHN